MRDLRTTRDTIKKESEVVVKNYKTIQAISFGHLKTNSNDWKMCKITGAHEDGAKFGVPSGYEQVQAWSAINKIDSIGGLVPCELCGHPIKNLYPIQCDRLKIYMYVGSECVNNFSGAGYTHKMIVEYKETTLMKIFKAWRGIAIDECWNDPRHFEINVHTGKPFAMYGRNAIKHDVWKFQNALSKLEDFDKIYDEKKKEWLQSHYTPKKDINELSTRKIVNFFKKAKEFGIIIPEIVQPLITPKPKPKKLDEK